MKQSNVKSYPSSSSKTKGTNVGLIPFANQQVNVGPPVLGGKYKQAKALLLAERNARRSAKGKQTGKKGGGFYDTLKSIAPLAGDVGEMISKYSKKKWTWSELLSDIVGKAGEYGKKFKEIFSSFVPMGLGPNQPFRTLSLATNKPGKAVQVAKLGVEQVGIASPFTITSPGAPVMTSSPGGTYHLLHGDFLQPLVVPAGTKMGDIVFELDLDPYMGRWLAAMANFERYKIRKVAVTYNPMCPTTTSGSLAGVFEFDVDNMIPAGNSDSTMQLVMAHQTASIVDIWTPHSWIFEPEDPAEWYYVVPGGHEPRLEKQGKFRLFAGADFDAILKAALLTVTYHIEFKVAELNSGPLGSYDSVYAYGTSGIESVYPTTVTDPDVEVNGVNFKLPRFEYIHIAQSITTAASLETASCGATVSSPSIAKETLAVNVSLPPGYWMVHYTANQYATGATLRTTVSGGYSMTYEANVAADGLMGFVDSSGAPIDTLAAALGSHLTSVGLFVKSTGHYSNGIGDGAYNQAIDWTKPMKGITFFHPTFIDEFSVFACPVSKVVSWTNTQTLLNRVKALERLVKDHEPSDNVKKDPEIQKVLVPCNCTVHKKL